MVRDYISNHWYLITNRLYIFHLLGPILSIVISWRYSEACSSTLATTYSSGSSGERKVVTTDLHHTCTSSHTGNIWIQLSISEKVIFYAYFKIPSLYKNNLYAVSIRYIGICTSSCWNNSITFTRQCWAKLEGCSTYHSTMCPQWQSSSNGLVSKRRRQKFFTLLWLWIDGCILHGKFIQAWKDKLR